MILYIFPLYSYLYRTSFSCKTTTTTTTTTANKRKQLQAVKVPAVYGRRIYGKGDFWAWSERV